MFEYLSDQFCLSYESSEQPRGQRSLHTDACTYTIHMYTYVHVPYTRARTCTNMYNICIRMYHTHVPDRLYHPAIIMNIPAKLVNIVTSIPVHSNVYNCPLYVLFLYRCYWSKSWPFASDNFSAIMSSRRFELILKFLHLNDSEAQPKRGEPAFDKPYKVCPFLDLVLENFQSSYQPYQQILIDESMISYKGRFSFIQYMRNKPHKWGLKAWVLADSTNGYTWGWMLYTGKEGGVTEHGLSHRVVMQLVHDP